MKIPTISVVFDRKKTATEKNAALIQIQIYKSRKERRYYSTGIKVFLNQFNSNAWVHNRSDALELNKKISDQINHIRECVKAICDSKESFSFDTLNYMLSDEVNLNSFLEFMQKRISKRKVAQGTKDGYNIALVALRKFKKINLFCDLTLPNIKAFDDFMKEELEISQTTVYLYHTVIKIFVKEAFNMGLISKNPYNEFKYSKGKSHKRKYLRDEEKDAFINTVPKDDYEKISKDLFIFCCYTGLSFSDLKKFNWEKDVYKTSNGSYYIDDCRNKTDINYKIVLLTPAMEILKEYNFKLPKIDYHMYRCKLRRMGERAGIKERVTPHVARHTFATWTLSQKIRLETVSKMLAHKNIATTQIYAKILQEEVFEAYDLLESKLSK